MKGLPAFTESMPRALMDEAPVLYPHFGVYADKPIRRLKDFVYSKQASTGATTVP